MADLPTATAPTAEQKYAKLLWEKISAESGNPLSEIGKIIAAADTDQDKIVTSAEWGAVRKQLLQQHPNQPLLNIMDKIFDTKAIAADGQDHSPITKADCDLVSNAVSVTQEMAAMGLMLYQNNLIKSALPDDKKVELFNTYREKFKKIDSNANGVISIGEMMMNNNGSLNITAPPIPTINKKPTVQI